MLNDSFRKRFKTIPLATSLSEGWGADPHNHSEFEILYFEKGNQTVKIGGQTYQTSAGDLICVNPMEVHSFTVEKGERSRSKCICFDCSLILGGELSEKLASEVSTVAHHIKGDTEHSRYLADLFLRIYDSAENSEGLDGEVFAMEVKGLITLFFAYIFKNNLHGDRGNKSQNHDFCSAVIAFVKEHYKERITSKEVASALSFNQSYFCRNFKKNFGVNFTEYLNVYRLSIARTLLEQKHSVTLVAYELGFQTPTQFSKCFKQKFGVLPSKYRVKSQ